MSDKSSRKLQAYLVSRLGIANSRRRQWLRYREAYSAKLTKNLEVSNSSVAFSETTASVFEVEENVKGKHIVCHTQHLLMHPPRYQRLQCRKKPTMSSLSSAHSAMPLNAWETGMIGKSMSSQICSFMFARLKIAYPQPKRMKVGISGSVTSYGTIVRCGLAMGIVQGCSHLRRP